MAEKEESANTEERISHLLKCVQGLQEILEDGIKKNSDVDGENIGSLLARTGGAAIRSYAATFRSLQVTSKSAFEGVFQKFFHYPKVQESYDELLSLENDWDQSLVVGEEKAGYDRSDSGIPSVGSLGPINVQLVNARTENAALTEHYDAIKSLNTKIVVISFGSPIGVRMWLDETGCPFDVLCDEKREVYKSFGLKTSMSKVWNIEVVTHYAERLAQNQKLHKRYENVQDDPYQMGGDFILDKNGYLALVHGSTKATDRPSVEQITTVLKTL